MTVASGSEPNGEAAGGAPAGASLAREILVSQRLRASILTVMILSGLALFLVAALLPTGGGPELHRRFRSAVPPVVLLSLSAVGYEVGAYLVAGRSSR
jgi:hypothetical protein